MSYIYQNLQFVSPSVIKRGSHLFKVTCNINLITIYQYYNSFNILNLELGCNINHTIHFFICLSDTLPALILLLQFDKIEVASL